MTVSKTTYGSLRIVLKCLGAQRDILAESGASADAVNAFSNVLRHLNGLSKAEVDIILAGKRGNQSKIDLEREATRFKESSLNELEEIINAESTSRKTLEAILVGRFKYPKGSLKTAGNMDQLRYLIASMIDNERTHSVIAEVAGRDA